MPKIEMGDELVEIIDCPDCGRTIFAPGVFGHGFIADCGKRLVNVKECSRTDRICPDTDS